MKILLSSIAVCIFWTSLASEVQAAPRKLAVLDLKTEGVKDSVAANLTAVVTQEADRQELFQVINMDDIRKMLEHEQSKMMLGCDDNSCLAEIGGAIGVELLLVGHLGKVGKTYLLTLRVIDVRNAKVIHRAEQTHSGSVEQLVELARKATREVLRPLMEKAAGTLMLYCTEEGAEVEIDGRIAGTTPLKPLNLAGGYHTIRVNKKRFITFAKELKVETGKSHRVDALLVPSPDFISNYEASAKRKRALAWTFTVAAVAMAGTTIGLVAWNNPRLSEYENDRNQFLFNSIGTMDEINERADSINLVDTISLATGIGSVVCLVTGLVFWLTGDKPGKYTRYDTAVEAKSAPAGLKFQLLPGRAQAEFRF